ncbi:hypothetical protein GOP47_0007116 [Adiantum capillus-veneris]|uniref:tRNA-uridine aminocarboxypropyltransferase n=1 Tax=Adiantum capillus-veneris TaxID=13818 RepID=A0A9D4V1I3_ADICA|nr:hypothetical protein GOP47_0007116 [Adiantum capillus-veneris]
MAKTIVQSADRVLNYFHLTRPLPAMASASGCRMYSCAGSFISEGHGSFPRDQYDRGLAADIQLESCEKLDNNAAEFIGRLSISPGYNVDSHNEDLHSPLKLVDHGYSSNGSLHLSEGFSAEHSDDMNGSASFSSADVELQSGINELLIRNDASSNSSVADSRLWAVNCCNGEAQHNFVAPESYSNKAAKRAFCKRCEKAQDLCICSRFKRVVDNEVKITILQNPKEKQHAVGSVRVALLGLKNVALVGVPEIYTKESFRIRPKVPGSKRSLAGRGGKKFLMNGGKAPAVHDNEASEDEVRQIQNLLIDIFKCDLNGDGVLGPSCWPSHSSEGGHGLSDGLMHNSLSLDEKVSLGCGNARCNGHLKEARTDAARTDASNGSLCLEDLECLIPPGVALLYPSDKAVELPKLLHSNTEEELEAPHHLLVLDGTWSKARRLYFENPWLHNLPHYKLSLPSPSLYEGVRKQPKPGCLSTLESIVYALKVLEPENEEGLDGLLEVFDSMVEDQRRCKQMKCCVQERGM